MFDETSLKVRIPTKNGIKIAHNLTKWDNSSSVMTLKLNFSQPKQVSNGNVKY
jgi:hypothetical protein